MNLIRFLGQHCVAALVLINCATTTEVRDVIDLPPPENVRGERRNGTVTVTWEGLAAGAAINFTGYLLYYAERSLANVPRAAMPKVVELPAIATEYSFAFEDSLPVFVHLRSRASRGQVSLPSLPELILPPQPVY